MKGLACILNVECKRTMLNVVFATKLLKVSMNFIVAMGLLSDLVSDGSGCSNLKDTGAFIRHVPFRRGRSLTG